MDWVVTAFVAAVAAVVGAVATVLRARLARARSHRRLEPVRAQIDEHLQAIARTLDSVGSHVARATTRRRDDLGSTLDLQALLEQIVAEASVVTGAQAAAIRVEGPGEAPVVASFGPSDGAALLDATLGPPDARPFRALTIDWKYGPSVETEEAAYHSALVVPVVEEATATGALVAYAGPAGAFQPEHLQALRALADDSAPAITNARRFAELGQRSLTDALTGVRNRSGYELELEREVARAHRTGQPLSLLVIEVGAPENADAPTDSGDPDPALLELATLLTQTARTTDIPCRRRPQQLAVVLPETRDDGARRFYARLSEQSRSAGEEAGGARQKTFSVGLVEWRPNETSAALDARAAAAVGRTAGVDAPEGAVATTIGLSRARRDAAGGRNGPAADRDPRRLFLEHLGREIAEARQRGRPLSVVALEVDDLGPVTSRIGDAAADDLQERVAARIDDSVDQGAVVSRFASDRFAVALPGAGTPDAQSMLAVLQASLAARPPEHGAHATVSAGVGELVADDDADVLLRRAEHALLRARSAGGGAVVVS